MLKPRLEMIVRHVRGESAADVGTDHGYAAIELAQKGMRVIASDIKPGPLSAAERNIKRVDASVELRLGAGLEPLSPGEADTIIIAGMGGEMIANILAASPETARESLLLLQPMNLQHDLRRFLLSNGYIIEGEDLAAEGHKIYNLIIARSGSAAPAARELDLHLPPCLYAHPLFARLCEKKRREFDKIYRGLSASALGGDEAADYYLGLLRDLDELAERLGTHN